MLAYMQDEISQRISSDRFQPSDPPGLDNIEFRPSHHAVTSTESGRFIGESLKLPEKKGWTLPQKMTFENAASCTEAAACTLRPGEFNSSVRRKQPRMTIESLRR
jgi:hypothetical protein